MVSSHPAVRRFATLLAVVALSAPSIPATTVVAASPIASVSTPATLDGCTDTMWATTWATGGFDVPDPVMTVIDSATDGIEATIALPAMPSAFEFAPDGRTAYLPNYNNGLIATIDTTSRTFGPSIPVPGGAQVAAMAISSDGREMWLASDYPQELLVLALPGGGFLRRIELPGSPETLFLSRDGSRAYVKMRHDDRFLTYDAIGGLFLGYAFTGRVDVMAFPQDATLPAYAPSGSFLRRLDQATGAYLASWSGLYGIDALEVAPDGARVYASSSVDEEFGAFEVSDGTYAPILSGTTDMHNPMDVAITPDGSKAYTVNFNGWNNDGYATAISLSDGSKLARIDGVLQSPRAIRACVPHATVPVSIKLVDGAGGQAGVPYRVIGNVTVPGTDVTGGVTVADGTGARCTDTDLLASNGAYWFDCTLVSRRLGGGRVKATFTGSSSDGLFVGSRQALRASGTLGCIDAGVVAGRFDGTGGIGVIDPGTTTVTRTIRTGLAGTSIAVTPSGLIAFVANEGSPDLLEVDLVHGTTEGTVGLVSQPGRIAMDPTGGRLYATRPGLDDLAIVNVATRTVTGSISTGDQPGPIALAPDGGRAYVANVGDATVSVIDLASETTTGTIPLAGTPVALAVSRDGTKLYVAEHGPDGIEVFSVETDETTGTVATPTAPLALLTDPLGDFVEVSYTDGSDTMVAPIEVATDTLGAGSPLPASTLDAVSVDGLGRWVHGTATDLVAVPDGSAPTIAVVAPTAVAAACIPAPEEARILEAWTDGTVARPGDWATRTFYPGAPGDADYAFFPASACLAGITSGDGVVDLGLGSLTGCRGDTTTETGGLELVGQTWSSGATMANLRPIDLRAGLAATFELDQIYADGITVFLQDAENPDLRPMGARGAADGYWASGDDPGVAGAVIGVQFDLYNADVRIHDGDESPGRDGSFGYSQLAAADVGMGIRSARIVIDPVADTLSVWMGSTSVWGEMDPAPILELPLPALLKSTRWVRFGIAASSGGVTGPQRIRNLAVAPRTVGANGGFERTAATGIPEWRADGIELTTGSRSGTWAARLPGAGGYALEQTAATTRDGSYRIRFATRSDGLCAATQSRATVRWNGTTVAQVTAATDGTTWTDGEVTVTGTGLDHLSFADGPDACGVVVDDVRVVHLVTIANLTSPWARVAGGSPATVQVDAGLAVPGCKVRARFERSGGSAIEQLLDVSQGSIGTTVTLPAGAYSVRLEPDGVRCVGRALTDGTLVVAPLPPRTGSAGGGYYTVTDGTTTKVGFYVDASTSTAKVGKTTTTTVAYSGSLVWVTSTGWRLRGTTASQAVTASRQTTGTASWVATTCPTGVGSKRPNSSPLCGYFLGGGALERWDQSANGGAGDWVFQRAASYRVTVYDGGFLPNCDRKTGVCTPLYYADSFGLQFTSDVSGLTGLPVSDPRQLLGPPEILKVRA